VPEKLRKNAAYASGISACKDLARRDKVLEKVYIIICFDGVLMDPPSEG